MWESESDGGEGECETCHRRESDDVAKGVMDRIREVQRRGKDDRRHRNGGVDGERGKERMRETEDRRTGYQGSSPLPGGLRKHAGTALRITHTCPHTETDTLPLTL